jgi:hypothetical protein
MPHPHPGVKLEHMPHHPHPYGAPSPAAPTPGRDSSFSQETAVDQEQYGGRGSAAGTSSSYGKPAQPLAGLPDVAARCAAACSWGPPAAAAGGPRAPHLQRRRPQLRGRMCSGRSARARHAPGAQRAPAPAPAATRRRPHEEAAAQPWVGAANQVQDPAQRQALAAMAGAATAAAAAKPRSAAVSKGGAPPLHSISK